MRTWLLTGASAIGPGHVVANMPNQDALLNRQMRGGFLSVVCDGMGSRPFAHLGSRFACRAVYDVIRCLDFDTAGQSLVERVATRWLSLLGQVPCDAATTTCLFCWGDATGRVRSFQLGDGRIIAPGMLDKEDGINFGNETIGMGLSVNTSDWIEHEFELGRGQGAVMMTDGISEDLEPGCEYELLAALIGSLKDKSSRRGKKSLLEELHDWPTPNHLDDKTISVVARL